MMSCVLQVLCALLTITLQVHDVTSWSFTPVSVPLLMTITDHIDSVTIMCQADSPLDKCQVNMYSNEHWHDSVDLSRGASSGVASRYRQATDAAPIYNVSYVGTGLEHGQCGAVFAGNNYMMEHFGCRGADVDGEWQDLDFLLAAASALMPATVTPVKAVAKLGLDVSMLLHSKPMARCIITPTANTVEPIEFGDGVDNVATDSYRYYGAGLSQGDCGITLLNVTEANNGPLAIQGETDDNEDAVLVSIVIVASPPAEMSFKVDKTSYSVGDTLKATCSSLLSRPVANLTWTLDDRIIRQDAHRDEGGDVWTWAWDKQNITQTLSVKLETGHFGKKLECRVKHLDDVVTHSDYVIKQKM